MEDESCVCWSAPAFNPADAPECAPLICSGSAGSAVTDDTVVFDVAREDIGLSIEYVELSDPFIWTSSLCCRNGLFDMMIVVTTTPKSTHFHLRSSFRNSLRLGIMSTSTVWDDSQISKMLGSQSSSHVCWVLVADKVYPKPHQARSTNAMQKQLCKGSSMNCASHL